MSAPENDEHSVVRDSDPTAPELIPPHSRDVYVHFGLALHWAQVLELEIGTALMKAWVLDGPEEPVSAEDFDAALNQYFTRPLGSISAKLKERFRLPLAFVTLLDDTRKDRNWLAHRFFRSTKTKLLNPEHAQELVGELRQVQYRLRIAVERLVQLMEAPVASCDTSPPSPRLEVLRPLPPWEFNPQLGPPPHH